METLVQQKILSSFTNEVSAESSTIQPINVDIKATNITRMMQSNTMTTNDGNYYIRYGGMPNEGDYYNAIEVYSVDSLDNNNTVYTFTNLKINDHIFYINKMKQSEDGRFYAAAQYYDGNNFTAYLIIFNNFIQDGYCKINKYYSNNTLGTSDTFFYDIAKAQDAGIYFIETETKLIKFEINVLEGNKTSIATIIEEGSVIGSYETQLNVLGEKLILTKLWNAIITPSGSPPYTKYEYKKAIANVNEELSENITLKLLYTENVPIDIFIEGAINKPYEAIIPYLNTGIYPAFTRIRLDGTTIDVVDRNTVLESRNNFFFYIDEDYIALTDSINLYLFYFKTDITKIYNFYITSFTQYLTNYKVLKQNNMINLIGISSLGTQESIVSIKNIYSPNVTSEPYFEYDFCLPYYMNLYSNSNDNTSLIFSRDATARFYSGNQITSTFIVPNYLLNDGNIEKASVYGKTNYLLNSEIKDFEKNKFESLYFNFIYNLNVIDNTNGLNTSNQIGSNKVANGLWKTFDNYDLRLTKARITYEDLSTEIINLNIPTVSGNSVTFNFEVSGNITKIEYLSNDESVVYATFRTNLTGTNTITQTIRVE